MTHKEWQVHVRTQQEEYLTTLNNKNMETKKKINWARIWQIIQAIITMILATETATRSL